jgi:ATPase subunit of ABC transporter with duplicated ATPase domains
MRIALAKLLLGRPNLLLLDEPTNHLDLDARNWLEGYLGAYPYAVILVSHDRYFLDAVVTRITDLNLRTLTDYVGNYSTYVEQRDAMLGRLRQAKRDQDEEVARVKLFIDRFRYQATKAAQVQSRIKALDKIERVELPRRREIVQFDFRPPPRSGDQVAILADIRKAYGHRVIYNGLNLMIRRGERWAVMGRNGAGKTTLLKIIAGALTPDEGDVRLGASLKLGYFAQQSLDLLDPALTIIEQLQEDFPREGLGVLRTLAGAFQFSGDDVDKKIRALSGGEKTRLVLARMLFDPPNFLVLDEPTNHLDLATKETLIGALMGYEGTMIFVSHDRNFLRGLANRVLELGGESGTDPQPHVYPGTYVEYVQRTGHEAPGVHN